AAVRIPASVMEAAHLNLDQAVDVREEDGRVVIEPSRPKDFSIDDLVNEITRANLHDSIDTGPAAGREVW
ncbi:MAG: PbsX family transcriptional regulator, partial [Propionivibrio sp.]